jgi:lipopolysaccharide biosynthesis regulator YciM
MRRWWRKPVASQEAESASARIRTALHRVLAGDLAGAELALVEAVKLDSSSADVYLALANVYRARGEIGRAIRIHQNLLMRSDLPRALQREAQLGLALDFRTGGFIGRSIQSFRELLDADPGNLQALRELERIHVEAGEWREAIELRKRIGRGDERTPSVLAHLWTGLGRVCAQAGDEREARRAFRRALRSDRRCAEAWLALADQSLRVGKPARAIAHASRTLDLHPAIGGLAYPRLFEAHERAGRMAALEELLGVRNEQQPEDRDTALWLARVQQVLGRIDDSTASLRRLLHRQPGALDAWADLGRAQLRHGRGAEALKTFEEWLEHLPVERRRLRCTSCSSPSPHLLFRCPQCGAWDSLVAV